MTQQQFRVEVVPVSSLQTDPANARKHSRHNIAAIAGSLKQFGQRRPLVVYGQTVIAGNGTLEAVKSLGWEKVAITRVPSDWSPEQARAYALADNRTAELAEWDSVILAEQLVELDAVGYDLAEFGFAPLRPPADPGDEWVGGMPDYEQDDLFGAFKVSIQFPTMADADAFFALIDRPKRARMWWPEDDGVQRSNGTTHQYVGDVDE